MARDVAVGGNLGDQGSQQYYQNEGPSALSSLEQFITPVRIEKGHPGGAATPGFRAPSVGGEDGNFAFATNSIAPTVDELDPYFPRIFVDDGSTFFKDCDYRIVANDGSAGDDADDTNIRKFEDGGGDRNDISVVKTMAALRGPMIMSGWGFDMGDMPMPPKGTTYPENTEFKEGLQKDRSLWKTGPVHLMWDDERQIWRGSYPIVCGVAATAIRPPVDVCSPTSFTVNVFRNTRHLGGRLSDAIEETISVKNRDPSLEQELIENAIFVIAIKLNYEWLPLWVGCPETPACGEENQPDVPECITKSTCTGS